MITILVLEDEEHKLQKIIEVIEAAGVSKNYVNHVNNVFDAKKELKANFYDLLILDIIVPLNSGGEPKRDGGLRLLNQINRQARLKPPEHIIGLTAYTNIKTEFSDDFQNLEWGILEFSPSEDQWSNSLSEKISHIIAVRQSQREQNQNKYTYDACIITALETPELTAVRQLPLDWEQLPPDEDDSTIYHRGTLTLKNKELKIIAACACHMGMPASTALATKMAMKFKPKHLWMLGICGGIKSKTQLGDIIVADRTWDYGSGKFKEDKAGKIVFAQDPHQCNLDQSLHTRVSLASTEKDFTQQIKDQYSGTPPKEDLSLILGPIASGAAVVSSQKYLDAVIFQNRKLVGIEMEAYGVMFIHEMVCGPKPKVIVAKSVCDFADPDKDDQLRDYAAYTSAQFFLEFTKAYMDF